MKLTKKYKKLKLLLRLESKLQRTKKQFFKSELKQNQVDIQTARESDIKKVQDVFEVKEVEPINVEDFFIDDSDIFDSEEISNADRECIIDFINRRFDEESNVPKMEIVHPEEKKLRGKNKCRQMTTKREKIRALKQFDEKSKDKT